MAMLFRMGRRATGSSTIPSMTYRYASTSIPAGPASSPAVFKKASKNAIHQAQKVASRPRNSIPAPAPQLSAFQSFRAYLRNPPRGTLLRTIMLDSSFHHNCFFWAVVLGVFPMAYMNTRQYSNFADKLKWDWNEIPTSLYMFFITVKRDMRANNEFVQEFRDRCNDDLKKRQAYREAHGLGKAVRPWWENIVVGYRTGDERRKMPETATD